jgi:hypothetical protein
MRLIQTAGRALCALLVGAVAAMFTAAPAAAQDPNTGGITLTATLDVPSLYYFRGLRQEAEPKLTLWPALDVGVALLSGDGAIKTLTINGGVWNSLHTGNLKDFTDRMHYELDFYTTATFGFGGGVSLAATYTAYTYPSFLFDTVSEVSVKFSKAHWLSPYGLLAAELSEASADGGDSKGIYAELGVAPSWALGERLTFAMPVKVGLSAKDYYELDGEDKKFGFLDVGAMFTRVLTSGSARFGVWNIHGGGDFYYFGDGSLTHVFNAGEGGDPKKYGFIGIVGIGVTY